MRAIRDKEVEITKVVGNPRQAAKRDKRQGKRDFQNKRKEVTNLQIMT